MPMRVTKPAVFIIDKNQNIRAQFNGNHLLDRPDTLEIVQQVEFIRGEDRPKLLRLFKRPNISIYEPKTSLLASARV